MRALFSRRCKTHGREAVERVGCEWGPVAARRRGALQSKQERQRVIAPLSSLLVPHFVKAIFWLDINKDSRSRLPRGRDAIAQNEEDKNQGDAPSYKASHMTETDKEGSQYAYQQEEAKRETAGLNFTRRLSTVSSSLRELYFIGYKRLFARESCLETQI